MSAGGKAPVVLVVGVGRSGTSLAMQALRRLGARVSERLVPASESNRRGALEDWYVRDEMEALWRRFDRFVGLRPPDWRADPSSRQVEDWLVTYLAEASRPGVPFAVKYPLASLFLPVWLDASSRADVPLQMIWATRRASAVVASQLRSYRPDLQSAHRHGVQRTLYLLEDTSDDTLLLPYEGWGAEPREQIAALAEAAALPLPDPDEALHDLYDPEEDHSPQAEAARAPVPAGLREVDRALTGRRGPLRGVLDNAERAALTTKLREALMQSSTEDGTLEASSSNRPEARPRGGEPVSGVLEAERDRLRGTTARLRGERDAAQGRAARLAAERDALRQRIEAVEAEATRVRRAYDALARERDLADVRLADVESRHAVALAEMEGRWREARAARKAVRGNLAGAEVKGLAASKGARADAAAQARIEVLRGKLKTVRERLRQEKARAKAEAEALRGELAEAKAALTERGVARVDVPEMADTAPGGSPDGV